MSRVRGRPMVLPKFNPRIPKVLLQKYALLAERAKQVVCDNHKPKSSLRWLQLYNKAIGIIASVNALEQDESRVIHISEEEKRALQWIRHNGKWNWEVPDDAIGRPNTDGA